MNTVPIIVPYVPRIVPVLSDEEADFLNGISNSKNFTLEKVLLWYDKVSSVRKTQQ